MRYLRVLVLFCCFILALNITYLYATRKSSSSFIAVQEKKSEFVPAAFESKPPEIKLHEDAEIRNFVPAIDPRDSPNFAPSLFQKNFVPEFILGTGRKERVSLVIGVPTVRRRGVSYLYATLNSLVRCIYPNEEDEVSIVVFIAENDEEYVRKEAKHIYGNFTREVDSGLLQVIGPPKNFYPDFDMVPETLGDSTDRTHWRSKEVLDAALAMHYARHKADYYVMTEDDVIVSYGYSSVIREFAKDHLQDEYSYLSFSSLRSIGKVFRSVNLGMWFSYFITFYNQKPIDWLMRDLVRFLSCNEAIPRELCLEREKRAVPELHYSVFQHIGKTSSLVGKIQNLQSSMFRAHVPLKIRHKNPKAKIFSTITSVPVTRIKSWYSDDGGMTKPLLVPSMKENETMSFRFAVALGERRIFIRTGSAHQHNRKRVCLKCLSIEILPSSEGRRPAQRNDVDKGFKLCANSDSNGNVECATAVPIVSLRIKANRNIYSGVWFDFIYVGRRKSTSVGENSPILIHTDDKTDNSLFTNERLVET